MSRFYLLMSIAAAVLFVGLLMLELKSIAATSAARLAPGDEWVIVVRRNSVRGSPWDSGDEPALIEFRIPLNSINVGDSIKGDE